MKQNGTESILKHFKIGGEFEFFTLDEKGYMTEGAKTVIAEVRKNYPKIPIVKECGTNMIEMGVPPDIHTSKVYSYFLSDMVHVMEIAKKNGVILYPFSTYPGMFTPKFNSDKSYLAKEKIFGKERWKIAAECVGHHFHYTLPFGVFDEENKALKPLINSKHKQSLVNIYNMAIAMDPVLTVFAQSSPFYRGQFLGKDSRVIAYRGGLALKYRDGLYTKYPKFGALQQYKFTGADLIHTIRNKNKHWLSLIKKYSPDYYPEAKKEQSILATSWNPVKVNPHGTIELRGMDINYPSVLLAIGTIIQFIGKLIQEDFVQVLPSDIGLVKPFRREENVIYIPPYSHVRLRLQYLSAYEGLASDEVYEYALALFKLAKKNMPKELYPLIEPVDRMLKTRSTVSDEILKTASKKGWVTDGKLSNDNAANLARIYSEAFTEDIVKTQNLLSKPPFNT